MVENANELAFREAQGEIGRLLGAWLFVLSDAVALVALLASVLAVGAPAPASLVSGSSWWLALSALAVLSISLELAGKRTRPALTLALAMGTLFLLVQVWLLRSALHSGLDLGGEAAMVVLGFHLLHVVALLPILLWLLLKRPKSLGPIRIYGHYLVGMWLCVQLVVRLV